MSNCQKCKHRVFDEGFSGCRAVWLKDSDEVLNLFKESGRKANEYDFALEYGKFRTECPYFEMKPTAKHWLKFLGIRNPKERCDEYGKA